MLMPGHRQTFPCGCEARLGMESISLVRCAPHAAGRPSRKRDITASLIHALRDFVSYGQCRQKNQSERNMLADQFAALAERYKPLLERLGVAPSQMSQVDFEEKIDGLIKGL